MKKSRKKTLKKQTSQQLRKLGLLIVCLYLIVGVFAAFSQMLVQSSAQASEPVLPVSQNLVDIKPILEPPTTSSTESSALVTASDSIVSIDTGYSLRLPVLIYHYIRDGVPASDQLGISLSVPTANFEQQMNYLASNGYHTVTPADLYFALENKSGLPNKSVLLTFDDGYTDFYTNAYPVLKKYQLRSTLFMIVDWIGRPGYLTAAQLLQMHSEGLVDVESHTLNHVSLPSVSSAQARTEIFDSKTKLENLLGKKVVIFCYPYGAYNSAVAQLVAQAGYVMAFSTRYGSFETDKEIYYLRRVRINGPDSLSDFIYRLTRS